MAFKPADDAELTLILACNNIYKSILEMKDIQNESSKTELLSLFSTDNVTELEMQFFRLVRKLGYREEDFEDGGRIVEYIESNK